MDALSDVLKSMRLEGAAYLNAEFTAPWCIQAKFGLAGVRARLAGAEQVLFFHFIAEGSCKFRLADGKEALQVATGDLVLFLNEDRHLLGSDLQLAPVESATLLRDDAGSDTDLIQMRHGGGGAVTRVVCGYVACTPGVCRPLLDALPRVLRVSVGDGPAAALLRELLKVGVRESSAAGPGAESMLAKLAELMFVEAMRRYVETLSPKGRGWLAGVRDAQIGRALALMHADPDKRWTLDGLARAVALSRSAFGERFTALVGESPMQYLTRWRLALAAQALRASGEALVRVAKRSGYDSEAAFTKAFKREFGVPPATWRKTARN